MSNVGAFENSSILLKFKTQNPTNFGARIRTDLKFVSSKKGETEYIYTVGDESSNLMGSLHGGVISFLADEISSLVIYEQNGLPSVTVNLTVNCMVGVPVGKTVRIKSISEKVGKQLAFADVHFYNEDNVLVATARHVKCFLNLKKSSL